MTVVEVYEKFLYVHRGQNRHQNVLLILSVRPSVCRYCVKRMDVSSGGGRYSDNRYSDISKWVMQWVRVRVKGSVSCAFSEAFVGIAAVGIAAHIVTLLTL